MGNKTNNIKGYNIIILKYLMIFFLVIPVFLLGCENTDVQTATEAGINVVKAMTLSDEEVLELAINSAQDSDRKNNLAPPEDKYTIRLRSLVGEHLKEDDIPFNFGVYLSPEVNAFAMANGTIRVYSGLMDMLNDGELRFVIGHEMGHVMKKHIRKKIQLAYTASAIRKGIASQNNTVGDVARSVMGDLVETLMNAQFSQLEEKEADDYGFAFLNRERYKPQDAVMALKKIAMLGKDHSFLSSHPDPDKRAERLQAQLEGKALPIDEHQQNILARFKSFFETQFPFLYQQVSKLLP